MSARLQEHYREVVRPALLEEFGYANPMQVPRLDKVVLNMGVGEAVGDSKKIDAAAREMALIAGQKPIVIRARRSVAQFKLREGMPVGVKVTLRRTMMYEFLDRLITIALPRVRDFRGLSPASFDGSGNYALGCRNRSSSPRSTTTRWTRCAAWMSSSSPPRRPTTRRDRCSGDSSFPS